MDEVVHGERRARAEDCGSSIKCHVPSMHSSALLVLPLLMADGDLHISSPSTLIGHSLTNLPVSREDIMMPESSDPLITIELSRADVTQLTGAECCLEEHHHYSVCKVSL